MLKLLKKTFRKSNASIAISIVYLAFCFGSAIYFGAIGRFPQMKNALVAGIFALPMIYVFERLLRFDMKWLLTTFVLFLIAGGFITGPSYNFYMKIPFFDDVLHCLSGFIFAVIGFTLSNRLLAGKTEDPFWYNLVFGFFFSLAVAVLWEMVEYAGTLYFGLDMQEDQIVTSFSSYLLSGTHVEVVNIDNIVKTVIYYGDNQTLEINGYLDIGLFDTLDDMLCCIIGSTVLFASFAINKAAKGSFDRAFVSTDYEQIA